MQDIQRELEEMTEDEDEMFDRPAAEKEAWLADEKAEEERLARAARWPSPGTARGREGLPAGG